MKRQSILLAMVVLLVGAAGSAQAGIYSGGDGSAENPYRIATAENMNEIGANPDDWDKHFIVIADIDLSDYTGTQFNIIGNYGTPFTGVFDGNGHTISNFKYTTINTDYIGLFGFAGGSAVIIDLTLVAPDVNAAGKSNYVGSLVGRLLYGTITGCGIEGGSVSGEDCGTGGLVGINAGTIENCYAAGSVTGTGHYTGGLVGCNQGTISNSYGTGSVTGDYNIGGLVGANFGTISNCYATWGVSGGGYGDISPIGGLVGWNSGTVSNCYATGSVINWWVGTTGGFVGENCSGGTITNSYSTGDVLGFWSTVGGFAGRNEGVCNSSFWDIETSRQTTSACGTGKTTAEMKQQATFTNWDFDTVWDIVENVSYPFLMSTPNPAMPLKGVDVSSWQGCEEKGGQDIDWSQVYGEGYRFAFVRASWWDSGVDKCFVTNMENGHTAGMLMGAYHFAYPEYTDAGSEARHFFNVAKDYLKEGYLMPALDIENDPDSSSYPYNLGPEGLSDWVNKWMDTVQALARQELGTEVEPMLYVNRTYANFLDEYLADIYDLWIAHPTCNPDGEPDTKKWNNWAFWQYYMPVPDGPCPDNSTGLDSVPGINGPVDLDVFNGDMSRLNTFKISAWEPDFWILYHLCSPADMIVTDPDGLSISKEVNQIPGAAYVEIDIDGDGDLDEEISIPYKKVGHYQITIVPEPNALPDDTYSLDVTIDGETMVLAKDVQIQEIPAEPYLLESKLNRSDFDADGDVDYFDLTKMSQHWLTQDCNYPDWCEGTDLNYNYIVDFIDFAIFAESWLWEKIIADIDIDGDVDFQDFAIFALAWLTEEGQAGYDSNCDIALPYDGAIDEKDLQVFTDNWLLGR